MDPGPPDGIPVVLFHGTAAWSKLWWPTTAALKNGGYRPRLCKNADVEV
jgi:pimeloyl-ACP methyl ester carboxylesterase